MLFKTNAGSLLKYLLLLQNVLAGQKRGRGANQTSKPEPQRRSEVSNEKPRVREGEAAVGSAVGCSKAKPIRCVQCPGRPAFLAVHSEGHSERRKRGEKKSITPALISCNCRSRSAENPHQTTTTTTETRPLRPAEAQLVEKTVLPPLLSPPCLPPSFLPCV